MKYKPGDKFIIEIDKPMLDDGSVYSIKGGVCLLTEYILDNLKPYPRGIEVKEKAEYQRGLADAWEAVKTMNRRITVEELREIFPLAKTASYSLVVDAIMEEYTAAEAIAKIREYEEEKEIKVGDEIYLEDWTEKKYVVTRVPQDDKRRISYIDLEGKTYSNNSLSQVYKTGRHFPEVAALLDKMKGETPDV